MQSDQHQELRSASTDEGLRRREFLERLAYGAGIGLSLASTLGFDTLIADAARRQRSRAVPNPRNWPIDTFVVLTMENRSFDHLLGWLPGADGRQGGLTYSDGHGRQVQTHALAPDFQGCGHAQPGHVWSQARVQLNGGKADGFQLPGSGNDEYALGYYRSQDIPVLASLAQRYTACDRYFASVLGSTNPNRAYAHAAQSYGNKYLFSNLPGDGEPQVPTPKGFDAATTIEGRLAARGLKGITFYSDDNYAGMWGPQGVARSRPISNYFTRAARGHLPALSFVDPQLQNAKELSGLSNDQHPFGDVRTGEAFMREVVNAFIHSPQWRTGALLITYDEWGGFYDHVPPPRVPDVRASANPDEDFSQMGFRVPAVLVSPWARHRHVDHNVFGHESLLRMVEQRFGLRPLTLRDARANSLATCFDFTRPPRLKPPSLPSVANLVSQPC